MNVNKNIIALATLTLFCICPAFSQLTYTDILLSPEKYVDSEVTMQGEFSYKNTERSSFDMKQGDNNIEVFYKNLSKEVQAAILNQKNFSKAPVTAKGTLMRFKDTKNSYYIMATDIQLR